jgi:cytoskeletal protein RodZ
MLSVGETLKRARLEQGLDLCAVAARTKINAKYLEAIESDDRKKLPSGFFYKSFVEQYARSLSLATQELDAEVDRILSADAPLPLPGYESVVARNVAPITSRRRFRTSSHLFASTATLLLVVAGCSGVYALWHAAPSSMTIQGVEDQIQTHIHNWMDGVRTLAKRNPAVASAKEHKPKHTALVNDVPAPSVPEPKIAPAEAIPVTLASDDPQPDEVDESTLAAEAAHSDYKPADYKVLLDLMAREATWLSVSSDGKPVFSGTLKAHETKTVSGKQFATLKIGNAAGVDVKLNGKLLGQLGARGQVLIVLFTPDNFEIVSPPKESD